ncbi:MAG: hypothetical protein KatS3mg014_1888 [Actinomycetota bacterium]|nr:MAG: hypothetical protein KatS3mg014_1888 [Actinomycetota bacterium]
MRGDPPVRADDDLDHLHHDVRGGDRVARLVEVGLVAVGPHPGVLAPAPRPPDVGVGAREGQVHPGDAPGREVERLGVGEDRLRRPLARAGHPVEGLRRPVEVVGCGAARIALEGLAPPRLVDRDQVRLVHHAHDVRRAPRVGEDRSSELGQDVGVGGPGAAHRPDPGGVRAVEDGDEAGDAALHELLEHDVRGVQARLGSGVGVVLDLDREGRSVGDHAPRRGEARERARGRRRRLLHEADAGQGRAHDRRRALRVQREEADRPRGYEGRQGRTGGQLAAPRHGHAGTTSMDGIFEGSRSGRRPGPRC